MKYIVTNRELLISNMLIRKGITTQNEIIDEIRKVQSEMNDKLSQSKKLN